MIPFYTTFAMAADTCPAPRELTDLRAESLARSAHLRVLQPDSLRSLVPPPEAVVRQAVTQSGGAVRNLDCTATPCVLTADPQGEVTDREFVVALRSALPGVWFQVWSGPVGVHLGLWPAEPVDTSQAKAGTLRATAVRGAWARGWKSVSRPPVPQAGACDEQNAAERRLLLWERADFTAVWGTPLEPRDRYDAERVAAETTLRLEREFPAAEHGVDCQQYPCIAWVDLHDDTRLDALAATMGIERHEVSASFRGPAGDDEVDTHSIFAWSTVRPRTTDETIWLRLVAQHVIDGLALTHPPIPRKAH